MTPAIWSTPDDRDGAEDPLIDLETEGEIAESIGERTVATGLPPGSALLLILVAGVELANVLLRALSRLLWPRARP